MDVIVKNANSMKDLGEKLGKHLKSRDVVYLIGDLGVGKTTMVQGLVRGFDYEGRVTSPTFNIMNIYPTKPEIYHYDFYRLEGEELDDLGLEDYLERDGIALIEWADLQLHVLPEEALVIKISLTDDDYDKERVVSFKPRGERYISLLEELRQKC